MELPNRNDEQGKPPMLFNKQVTVFLVCLSISLVFWLLQALSSSYPATIVFPVHYHHLPVKKVIVNELPAQITVDLKTTGFRIIYYSFEKEKEPIDIDVSSGMTASGVFRDAVTIPTLNFEEDFLRQLGSDVEFVSFHPDSIVLMFTDKVSKRVPVLPEVNFSLRRQYDTVGAIRTLPDSVVVSGPPSVITGIRSVSTATLRFNDLHDPVSQKATLRQQPMVEYEPASVQLLIGVEKFTEGEQEVAVHAVNVPSGYVLRTFPEKIKVRYQAAISQYASVNPQQFEVVVDAGKIPDRQVNLLPLRLVSKPAAVHSVTLDPPEVEFIFRKQ